MKPSFNCGSFFLRFVAGASAYLSEKGTALIQNRVIILQYSPDSFYSLSFRTQKVSFGNQGPTFLWMTHKLDFRIIQLSQQRPLLYLASFPKSIFPIFLNLGNMGSVPNFPFIF